VPAPDRAIGELAEQPRLTDARGADDLHGAARARLQAVERGVQQSEFRPAAYEVVGELKDARSARDYTPGGGGRPRWCRQRFRVAP
jgi:hypothetical protein